MRFRTTEQQRIRLHKSCRRTRGKILNGGILSGFYWLFDLTMNQGNSGIVVTILSICHINRPLTSSCQIYLTFQDGKNFGLPVLLDPIAIAHTIRAEQENTFFIDDRPPNIGVERRR